MGPFFIILGVISAFAVLFLFLDKAAIKKRPDYKPKVKKNKEDKLIEKMAETVAKTDIKLPENLE